MEESTPSTRRGAAPIASAGHETSAWRSSIRSNSRAAVVAANSTHTERSFDPSTLATPGIATVGDSIGRDLFSPLQSVNLDHKRLSGNIGSGGIFAPTKSSRSKSRAATNVHTAKVRLWGYRRAIRYATFVASAIAGIVWFGLIQIPSRSILHGSRDSFGSSSTSAAYTTSMATLMADATSPSTNVSGGFRYEVFGKVQGVFFRKHTQREASRLELVGWVRNTDRSSVEGEVAGRRDQIEELAQMRHWLGKVGSPKSVIERADFAPLPDDRVEELLKMNEFVVRKTKKRASEMKKK